MHDVHYVHSSASFRRKWHINRIPQGRFSWNGAYHGRAQGATLFAETYQHLVAQVALGGADNITWVLHVNDGADPDRDWNRMATYDPGPQVCPWVAVSVYGQQLPTGSDWWSFRESLDGAWPDLTHARHAR